MGVINLHTKKTINNKDIKIVRIFFYILLALFIFPFIFGFKSIYSLEDILFEFISPYVSLVLLISLKIKYKRQISQEQSE